MLRITLMPILAYSRAAIFWSVPVAASVFACVAGAQIPKAVVGRPTLADSSVSALMRLARQGSFPRDAAVEILRQGTQRYPQGKRLALADSITAFAIQLRGAAISAVGTIKQWGLPEPQLGGQADPVALTYLIRISREANDAETRSGAIRGMADQITPGRAVSYLKEIATSAQKGEALAAVSELQRLGFGASLGTADERAEAANALRALYDGGSMKSGAAISELCQIAAWQRWPAKSMCRGRA